MIEILRSNKEIWDLFTRREEYNTRILDQYQRFPYYLSFHRNIFEPKVSEFLIKNGLKVKYPNDKKFAVCLTHDIDVALFTKLEIISQMIKLLRKLELKKSLEMLLSRINKNFNSRWNFKKIINLEEKYDSKSSFYFLSIEESDLEFNFKIEVLNNELGYIVDKGFEVGLQGSHRAYNSLDEIKKEKERLEKVLGKNVIGYRNHYLRFKTPNTWELLKKTGFKYDTTFGYADCIGFRNGMCHPFKPFNLNTNKKIDILEIPLIIMDGTLFTYMKLDIKTAWEITKNLIDVVEKYNGVITILWHNTYMENEFLKFYENILKYCHEKNAWLTSGEEICNWWEKNESFSY